MTLDDYFDVTFYEDRLSLDDLLEVAREIKKLQLQIAGESSFSDQIRLFHSLYVFGSNLIRYQLYGEGIKSFENALAIISENQLPTERKVNVPMEYYSIIDTLTAFYMKTKQYEKLVANIQEHVFVKDVFQVSAIWGEFFTREATRIQCSILRECDALCGLVGVSVEWLKVLRQIQKYSKTNNSILIKGPSGAGKELVANAIHKESGRKNFKAINCASITDELAGSALFGHEKGSFTGAIGTQRGYCEDAEDGTLNRHYFSGQFPGLAGAVFRTQPVTGHHCIHDDAPDCRTFRCS